MAKVITIPATRNKMTARPLNAIKKRKVAAYARVSTDHEDQQNSYEAQIDYYTGYIAGRDDWDFVKVYADEGITGCNTKARDGFNTMVSDALAGKIDLIVTKSVSRFARNTVDSLSTIRKLKEKGVEVYFEKEQIWTFDGKGEVLITIMSSLAQEESRSISENSTWGQRKRFADGKVSVPFGRFLGYERGPEGELVVNEEQAVLVRRIYGMFLQGHSPYGIAKKLTAEKIPTPGGKEKWCSATVKSILTNEKYKGDALLQKVYTVDFLSKKKKVNEGEVPQYYVEGDHEAIIEPEIFDSVQSLIQSRCKGRTSCVNAFSGKIKCGQCGSWYGSKVWHSNSKYRRTIWRCNGKYSGDEKCSSPHLTEDAIKDLFIKAVNKFCEERDVVIAVLESIGVTAFATESLETERSATIERLEVLADTMERYIERNASVAQDQTKYRAEYALLESQAEETQNRIKELEGEIQTVTAHQEEMKRFITELKQLPEIYEHYDETTWYALVDFVTVYSRDNVRFTFRNGTSVTVGEEK